MYQNRSSIKRALESVSCQFSDDMELIIIDDASTDNGLEIATNLLFELGVKHFKVIVNIQNQGAYYSRNLGIQSAKNEYLMFLDADDELIPDCFDHLACHVKQCEPDLILFDILLQQEGKPDQILSAIPEDGKQLELIDYVKSLPSPCNKLVRRSVYTKHHITFPKTIYEDLATSYRLVLHAKQMTYLRQCFYVYNKANKGNVSSITDQRITQLYDVMEQMLKDLTAVSQTFSQKDLCDIAVPALFNQYLMVLTIPDFIVVQSYYDHSIQLLNRYFGSSWSNHDYFHPKNIKQKLIRTMLKSKWSYLIFNRLNFVRNFIKSNYRL